MKRKKEDTFEQDLKDLSETNNNVVKDNKNLMIECRNLYKDKYYTLPTDVFNRYSTLLEEISLLEGKSAQLITSFNRNLNDYWHGRGEGVIEETLNNNLSGLLKLSKDIKSLLEECIALLTYESFEIVNALAMVEASANFVPISGDNQNRELSPLFSEEEISMLGLGSLSSVTHDSNATKSSSNSYLYHGSSGGDSDASGSF